MSDATYKMSKTTKALLASCTPEERLKFKAAMVVAEWDLRTKESFTMNYDVKPGGKRKSS